MKQIYKHINAVVALALLTTLLPSCKKDFLEVVPKGKLIAQKVSDYDLLLNNFDFVNIDGIAQVPMGDEVAAVEPYFSGADVKTQRLFRWDDIIYEPNEDANEAIKPMQNIYMFNKIINEVPDAAEGTVQRKKSIAAEAMAGRAWAYFLLINYFGKPYNEMTSATDLGLPIVKTADVTETKFTRASVKEVYDFIVNDLVTAIPDLPVKTTHRLRMSKAAAEGLLGKVYMFMGKFGEALPLLNASLTDISSAAVAVRLYNYNSTFATGGIFMPIGIFGPEYPNIPDIEEDVFAKQAFNSWAFINNEIVISPETAALYETSDLRLKLYSTTAFFGSAYPLGMLRRYGPATIKFGVVVPDLYLLRAECKARLEDLSGAVADVETLRKNRMPVANANVPIGLTVQKLSLLKFIMEERIREFAVQGYRWFDMRRMSVDPLFAATTYKHYIYSGAGEVTKTFTLRSERLVLQLPKKFIDQNPGMQNNP